MARPFRLIGVVPAPVFLTTFAAVLFGLRCGPAVADNAPTIPTQEERTIFLQLLSAPDDPVLNLKYARLAMKQGRVNRALEAFRRVLAADPVNAEALKGIKKIQEMRRSEEETKPQTNFSLVTGAQYESNAPHQDPSFDDFEDTTANAGLAINDRRQVFGHNIETQAQVYKTLHNRYRAGDLLYLGIDSGPVYNMESGTLRVAPLIRYARINTRKLFLSTGVAVRYLRDTEEAFKGFSLRISYDDYKSDYEVYQGPRLEAHLKYQYYGLMDDSDSLLLVPSFYHVHGLGDGGSHRYEGMALTAAYSRPLSTDMVFTGSLTVEGRWYASKESTEPTNSQRKDIRFKPEARVVFLDLLPESGQLETRINYQANFSNDFDKRYRGYLIGATARWDF